MDAPELPRPSLRPAGEPPDVTAAPEADLVVPTIGRPSLDALLEALAGEADAQLASLTLVDDRPSPDPAELADRLEAARPGVRWRVLATGGRGPAAARNAGWRAGRAPWVVFLDDDVLPQPGWGRALAQDLASADGERGLGAVRGVVEVPTADRAPTDWERQVAGLASAPGWLTADLAVRRAALEHVGGLDERFPRAYREDTDLELRVRAAGWTDAPGRRAVTHPVGPADRWVSVRRQRGNADDVLMVRLHGRGWRRRVGEPAGAFPQHLATVGAAAAAGAALVAGRRRWAAAAAAVWAVRTARFTWHRVAPGPRTAGEVATMTLTSVAIPPAAVYHRAAGWRRWWRVRARTARSAP
jgi:glycosyltransferase involved in cell wall biosynthesis